MFDVGAPSRNAALTALFVVTCLFAMLAAIPWRRVGAPRVSRGMRWLLLPALVVAVCHELLMPARFDIRLDLLLLAPMYALIVGTSLVRWYRWRSR